MNSCQHSSKIIDYMIGLLKPDEQIEFETHLENCALCQQEMKLESMITDEFEKTLDPGEIERIVLAKLRLRRELNKGFSWGYAVRGVAYGLAVAVVGVVFIPRFLSVIIRILNKVVPIIPSLSFDWLKSFGWIESFGSITTVLSNLYVVGGIGIAILVGSIVYTLYVMRAQFSLSQ